MLADLACHVAKEVKSVKSVRRRSVLAPQHFAPVVHIARSCARVICLVFTLLLLAQIVQEKAFLEVRNQSFDIQFAQGQHSLRNCSSINCMRMCWERAAPLGGNKTYLVVIQDVEGTQNAPPTTRVAELFSPHLKAAPPTFAEKTLDQLQALKAERDSTRQLTQQPFTNGAGPALANESSLPTCPADADDLSSRKRKKRRRDRTQLNLALAERTQILAEHLGVVDKVLRVREGIGIVRLGLETCSNLFLGNKQSESPNMQ